MNLLPSFITRKYHKRHRKALYRKACELPDADLTPSDDPIDVVIPIIERDLAILPLCMEGVRRCVANKVAAVYIVAAPTETIKTAADRMGAIFVDESGVLGYDASDLHIITRNGADRSGWIFQQLLKLSGAIGQSRRFMVIDADHILLRPHVMADSQGRHVMYMSEEYNSPYYANMRRLTGIRKPDRLSYVAHKMIFDRVKLKQLRDIIEKRHGNSMSWDKVITSSLDLKYASNFSEFELYGNFLPDADKVLIPWRQKALVKSSVIPCYDELVERYAAEYRSVTYPYYMAT